MPKELIVDFANAYPYNSVIDVFYGASDFKVTVEDALYIIGRFNSKEYKELIDDILTERERDVFFKFYKEHKTLEEIGKCYGVTKERIRQIKHRACRKLYLNSRRYTMPNDVTPLKVKELIDEADHYKRLCEAYAAHLDRFLGIESVKNCDIEAVLETPIINMELSVRSYNCLVRAGINTIGDLVATPVENLIRIRNLGRRSLQEIETVLHNKYNLNLKTEENKE